MNVLRLTKKDFKKSDSYWSDYIGKTDVSDYDGHIDIEGNLGWVRFVSLRVSGNIGAEAGSGIEAGWGIEAGLGIEADWGIEAGWGIKAGSGIVTFFNAIKAKLSITANLKATISAGIFNFDGPQDIEAQEIIGNVIYGNKKLLPKEENLEVDDLHGQEVTVTIKGKTYTAIVK